jgi:hypothetical protein
MILPKIVTLLAMVGGLASAKTVDLSGEWRFALDQQDLGRHAKPEDWRFPDKIKLPGILTAQGFGETPSFKTQWTGDGWRYPELFKEWQTDDNFKFPFFLQPPKQYVGPAWYQREIVIPEDWEGSDAVLHLERVHWQSIAWMDGKEMGQADSLGTPHEFDLGALAPGKHWLTLRIDNRLAPVNVGPLSHSVTDHTQGNWNGVVGKVELRQVPGLHLTDVRIDTLADGTVKLEVGVISKGADAPTAKLVATVHEKAGGKEVARVEEVLSFSRGTTPDGFRINTNLSQKQLSCRLATPPRMWSEFAPDLYEARVRVETPQSSDERLVTFGFRQVGTKDGRITINGRKTYLRGTLECCIFPLLGHPPTDVESWKRIVKICKAHGLNHIRFHSWCPPEAAFQAADEIGFYYQVEVSSWANQGAEVGSNRPLDAWLEAETKRMLAAYGNHPSFIMLAYGNEPAGKNHQKWLQDWVARRKAEDPRRLYTTGAGWPVVAGSDFHSSPDPRLQGWGQGMGSIINGQAPRTDFDWSDFVKKHTDAPVISHEIGQWCVYPNFDEIAKYTGYFKAKNFEIFQETARRNGLLGQARDFLNASGKLQALAYKHDIEAALRTPGFGGFQLLDLHDFPGQGTALVGVLDAFWDEKGYISPAEFSRFCGPIVPLARLKKMTFTTAETLEAELELAQFGPTDLKSATPIWKLATSDGTVVAAGRLAPRDLPSGDLHQLGRIRVPLATVPAPAKLVLTLGVEGQAVANSWEVFVYSQGPVAKVPTDVLVTADLDEAKAALAKGGKVLWMPPAQSIMDDPQRPLTAGFSPIFWNTAWTNWQPPHTLGILCDPQHPALSLFPTDSHSNWQWWEIQHQARSFILTKHHDLKPLVQVIDDWVTNRKLGYVFEAKVGGGKVIACGAELNRDAAARPVARQLLASLLSYMKSDKFAPAAALAPADLDGLVRPLPLVMRLDAKASSTSAEPGYEAAAAVDGNPATMWHTVFTGTQPPPPHDLTLRFKDEVALTAVLLTQRQDHNANGQVAEVEIVSGGKSLTRSKVPKHAVGFRVPLPAGTRVRELTLRVHSSHAGTYASLAELDVE